MDQNAWQPIDSVPRDGRRVLLVFSGHHAPIVGYWNGRMWTEGDSWDLDDNATHWMPCPAMPNEREITG